MKDIIHLLLEHTHVGPKSGWLLLSDSEEKALSIYLPTEAQHALYVYLVCPFHSKVLLNTHEEMQERQDVPSRKNDP